MSGLPKLDLRKYMPPQGEAGAGHLSRHTLSLMYNEQCERVAYAYPRLMSVDEIEHAQAQATNTEGSQDRTYHMLLRGLPVRLSPDYR